MPSGAVSLCLPLPGVVVTWLVTGFPDLPSEGGVPHDNSYHDHFMSLQLDGRIIVTARFSQRVAADGHGAWIVSCRYGGLFTRWTGRADGSPRTA
jgi:hypothetical protein